MPAIKESVMQAHMPPHQHQHQHQHQHHPPPRAARPAKSAMTSPRGPKHRKLIVDIRTGPGEDHLKEEVVSMFNPQSGARALPTILLYDAKGLQLFEEITFLDEYYLTNCEIELLETAAIDIARKVPEGAMVVELGSGNLRKVSILLNAFEALHKRIDYFALDLSVSELQRTINALPDYEFVACHGLLGTYDEGREWLKGAAWQTRPKCIIHLGSSIGNFDRHQAADFLTGFADILKPEDVMIVGVDSCVDPEKVYRAYNDRKGVTHSFILNGLSHANDLFGEEVFRVGDWKVIGEYVYDNEGGRHQAFLSPIRETMALGHRIMPGERVKIEQSLKYSLFGTKKLWKATGMEDFSFYCKTEDYGLHLLQRAKLPIGRMPYIYAKDPLPGINDWQSVWQAWGTVTQSMLPRTSILDKPIQLRNPFIFYLGHIPCFLDIQLSKVSGILPTHPSIYQTIFERGIDPDVDNPELCHRHSATPEEWPEFEDIILYQNAVRGRLLTYYNQQELFTESAWLRRAVWTGFEHEVMHLETLLYMLLQSDRIQPPTVAPRPDFEAMAKVARDERVPNEWFDIPEQVITVGLDDPEDDIDPQRPFGWDIEKPERKQWVHAFQAKGRAITNEEYANYLHATQRLRIPASWAKIHVEGSPEIPDGKVGRIPIAFLFDKAVRTVYGLIPLRLALDWPVFASYDELAGCAAWMGGRIPTADEARSIYAHAEVLKKKNKEKNKLANKVPAVNGHLSNDGVQETPPAPKEDPPPELYLDLLDENVGFRHWHPVSVAGRGNKLAGQAGLGGVWEWTSSVLAPHRGFEPMTLYPEYTTDFFDGKHNVVLGGSWATHPRVAGRRSFVNWYQRNYAYAWVGARMVRDVNL